MLFTNEALLKGTRTKITKIAPEAVILLLEAAIQKGENGISIEEIQAEGFPDMKYFLDSHAVAVREYFKGTYKLIRVDNKHYITRNGTEAVRTIGLALVK